MMPAAAWRYAFEQRVSILVVVDVGCDGVLVSVCVYRMIVSILVVVDVGCDV